MVKIRKESWMGQLNKCYKKILTPSYSIGELDQANVIITDALSKLEQIIKEHKAKERKNT